MLTGKIYGIICVYFILIFMFRCNTFFLFHFDRYAYLRMKAMKLVDDFWKPFEMYTIACIKFEEWYNELDEIAKTMRDDMSTEHVGASTIKQLLQK